jgi:TonB-linked SusC/RagA family outer membrane protein
MKKFLLLSWLALSWLGHQAVAQDRNVSGKVTSVEDGSTLPAVNVVVKGTTNGVATDASGSYQINVPANAILVFSFIGLETQEIPVGNQTVINVSLKADVRQLGEVVVTAVGISKEKKSLGYATTQVSNDELTQGQNTNPINALQGKVAGLNITSGSNAPGSSSRIVLRGPTSFTGNNQPLFVIDGIIISNGNFQNSQYLDNQVDYGNRGNDINPQDIESISVLKGPAAAALYGSVASNGAIIITTKKGLKGKMNISLNSNVTFSDILKLPDFQNEYGQGDRDVVKDDRRENFNWGLPFDGKERPWGQVVNGKQQLKKYEALPNNVKDFFDTGKTFNNTLSLSGGNEKSTYYLSLGAQNSTGVIPTTEYTKYNIRFNGTSQFSSKFSSAVSVNFTNINGSPATGGQGDAFYNQIIQTPRDISIVDLKDQSNPFNGVFTGADGTQYYGYYGAYTKNPYFLLDNNKNSNKVDRITGNFTLNYKPIEGLNITERIGGDIYSDQRYQRFAKYDYAPIDPFYGTNNSTNVGKYSSDIYNYSQINHDLIITYNGKITSDLDFKVLVGNNIRKTTLNNTYVATNPNTGIIVPGLYTLDNSDGPLDVSGAASVPFQENAVIGVYGEATFSFKNLLFLGVTGRNDWSSTLPKANRSFYYPSINSSFVFSDLLGTSIRNVLSYGKVRASWAKVGSDAPAYRLKSVYTSRATADINGDFGSTKFPFNSVPGFTLGDRIGNDQLTPEFVQSFEVGTELGFLNNRINFDVTYFNTKSTNLIIDVPVSPSSGFSRKTQNAGEMKNEGLELAIRATPIKTESGFKFDIFGTFTKIRNKVVSIAPGVEQISVNTAGSGISGMTIVAAVGKPYGTFYGTAALRDTITGKIVVDGATGLPVSDPKNRYFGSYQADYLASLGATFSYKGFALRVLFDTKQGGVFYSHTKETMDFVGSAPETTTNDRKDFVYPNSVIAAPDGKSYFANTSVTLHPYTYYTSILGGGKIPELMLVDASYIKFREASINYTVPSNFLKKTPFSDLTIGVFGNNLFIWTPKQNQYADPEINSQGASNVQGFEFSAAPSLRNYGFNIRVSL